MIRKNIILEKLHDLLALEVMAHEIFSDLQASSALVHYNQELLQLKADEARHIEMVNRCIHLLEAAN